MKKMVELAKVNQILDWAEARTSKIFVDEYTSGKIPNIIDSEYFIAFQLIGVIREQINNEI